MAGDDGKLSQSVALITQEILKKFHDMNGTRASGLGLSINRANNNTEESITNKIHFFKFDQRIITFYNVETEKKTRELLNIDFNIPIRFCSI